MNKGIIYLTQPEHLVGTNRYKIGCSNKKNDLKKLQDYHINTRYLCIMECYKPFDIEANVKNKFNEKINLIAGNEWYDGDEKIMIKYFFDLVFEYINNNEIIEKINYKNLIEDKEYTYLDEIKNQFEEYFQDEIFGGTNKFFIYEKIVIGKKEKNSNLFDFNGDRIYSKFKFINIDYGLANPYRKEIKNLKEKYDKILEPNNDDITNHNNEMDKYRVSRDLFIKVPYGIIDECKIDYQYHNLDEYYEKILKFIQENKIYNLNDKEYIQQIIKCKKKIMIEKNNDIKIKNTQYKNFEDLISKIFYIINNDVEIKYDNIKDKFNSIFHCNVIINKKLNGFFTKSSSDHYTLDIFYEEIGLKNENQEYSEKNEYTISIKLEKKGDNYVIVSL